MTDEQKKELLGKIEEYGNMKFQLGQDSAEFGVRKSAILQAQGVLAEIRTILKIKD